MSIKLAREALPDMTDAELFEFIGQYERRDPWSFAPPPLPPTQGGAGEALSAERRLSLANRMANHAPKPTSN